MRYFFLEDLYISCKARIFTTKPVFLAAIFIAIAGSAFSAVREGASS
jgi:hypothetical protein